jgi:hypothetical protein
MLVSYEFVSFSVQMRTNRSVISRRHLYKPKQGPVVILNMGLEDIRYWVVVFVISHIGI